MNHQFQSVFTSTESHQMSFDERCDMSADSKLPKMFDITITFPTTIEVKSFESSRNWTL